MHTGVSVFIQVYCQAALWKGQVRWEWERAV